MDPDAALRMIADAGNQHVLDVADAAEGRLSWR